MFDYGCLMFLDSPMQLMILAIIALLIFGHRLPPFRGGGPGSPRTPFGPSGIAPVTDRWKPTKEPIDKSPLL